MSTRLTELAISDTGFIFDPGSGATFNVNATGLIALAALREGVDPPTLPRSRRASARTTRPRRPTSPTTFRLRTNLAPDGPGGVADWSAIVSARPLTIAVTGLNATDNPGPGVPVLRSLRDGARAGPSAASA